MTPTALAFVVDGPPVPLERARVMRNRLASGRMVTRTITPARSAAYRERVQLFARVAIAGARWKLRGEDRYELTLRIFWSDARRRDGSNLLKAIEDAGNDLLWPDDSQIEAGHFYCAIDRARPRVEVEVRVSSAAEAT